MNDILNRINEHLLNVDLLSFVVFMKLMDINLWQHFFDNQHFAQFVPNLFGKIFLLSEAFFLSHLKKIIIIRIR
jgi:hypothetical protein